MIPYGQQSISEEDIQAVVDVLRSGTLTQGPAISAFENAVCSYTGVLHGVAVNSGTAALHIACRALGLGPGDKLWTTPITFVASANCALYCGAEVDFVDIDPRTWNLSLNSLEQKLEQAERSGELPKIVVPVHLCGLPCDMEAISILSKRYGFHIVEDACHAIGGNFKGEPIGNCRYSDVTVFSFHPVKNIATGEGGMAVTNREDVAEKMKLLRSHGITRDPDQMTHEPDGPWYYQQIGLGYNYRMTDIQAALGVSQLKRLDRFIGRRHELANRYNKLFSDLPVQLQYHPKGYYSGMHLYVVRLQLERMEKTHREVFEKLRESGIGVNLHYIPIHYQPWYQAMGFTKGIFPQAESYYQGAISLPLFPDLRDEQCDTIVDSFRRIVKNDF